MRAFNILTTTKSEKRGQTWVSFITPGQRDEGICGIALMHGLHAVCNQVSTWKRIPGHRPQNKTKQNKTKQTKPNQTKPNQTKTKTKIKYNEELHCKDVRIGWAFRAL